MSAQLQQKRGKYGLYKNYDRMSEKHKINLMGRERHRKCMKYFQIIKEHHRKTSGVNKHKAQIFYSTHM